jgi:hypothetical protein
MVTRIQVHGPERRSAATVHPDLGRIQVHSLWGQAGPRTEERGGKYVLSPAFFSGQEKGKSGTHLSRRKFIL